MRAAPTKISLCALFYLATAIVVGAEIYFEENFPNGTYNIFIIIIMVNVYFMSLYHSTDSFETEWTYSEHPGKDFGKFVHRSGAFYNDLEADKGIQTLQDGRFYALSRKFLPFSNEGKILVIQYTVKHEQTIDCGGGYIKLFNCSLDPKQMHGETPYEIMFGKYISLVF